MKKGKFLKFFVFILITGSVISILNIDKVDKLRPYNPIIKDLSGKWEGNDWWGPIDFKGMLGSYTYTYNKKPGKIVLKKIGIQAYSGHWGEGTNRHGKIKLRFISRNIIAGNWTVDPDSQLKNPSKGVLHWRRTSLVNE
jgi:hypothetical protein